MKTLPILFLLLGACLQSLPDKERPDPDTSSGDTSSGDTSAPTDADGDSFTADDCDDHDASIHPGASETCNGEDDDCDGGIPEEEADADGDGSRTCGGDCDDADPGLSAADADGDGFSTCDGDCDDDRANEMPGRTAEHGGVLMTCVGRSPFVMGSPESEVGHDHDEDQHRVRFTKNLLIGVYEVTQEQFRTRMGYTPSFHESCDSCPVEEVSWHEAAAFANALSTLEGLQSCYSCSGPESELACRMDTRYASPYDCPGYRLPTEAEWERAARAGSDFMYAGSDEPSEVAWTSANATTSQPVGTLASNGWKLQDMSGNVWEWTADGYAADITALGDDPWLPCDPDCVARGGAFSLASRNARVAYRNYFSSGDRNYALGFRVVRSFSDAD